MSISDDDNPYITGIHICKRYTYFIQVFQHTYRWNIHVGIHKYSLVYIYIYTHTHRHSYRCMHMHTYTHSMHTWIQIGENTYTYMYTYTHSHAHKYTHSLAKWVEWSLIVRETCVQSQVASYQRLKKWHLILPSLTLSIIRYGSRVKWSNPGEGVAPSPTPRCSSFWKGSLRVVLDKGHQLYLTSEYICSNRLTDSFTYMQSRIYIHLYTHTLA